MKNKELIPDLFRTEFSKIVAVLCNKFGLSNIQLAEDFVSDTFLIASETWSLKGIPNNPTAWLYTVSKNKAKDYFKREVIFNEKISPILKFKNRKEAEFDIDLSKKNIEDSQLKMMFAVCNPLISKDAQVSLALRILSGFGVDEIAQAFLTKKETINKRLYRAKEVLRKNKVDFSFPSEMKLDGRMDSVLLIIYLIFNEGYHSKTAEKSMNKTLCFEAMRLLKILLDFSITNTSNANALMALFCFHSSRFGSRFDSEGAVILMEDQNQQDWDFELIKQGEKYLNLSAKGRHIHKYHLEAAIAFWHTRIMDEKEKWNNILQLYNRLLQVEYSPIIALNRTFALAKAKDYKTALSEALKINLKDNYLYHSFLAELYSEINKKLQKQHLIIALDLCDNTDGKRLIEKKLKRI